MVQNEYIIENKEKLVKDYFIKFAKNSEKSKIATGYFYLNGYKLVSDSLEKMDKMQLVIGNEIPLTINTKEHETYKNTLKMTCSMI